ncbi:hypothetical protein [Paenibacillus gansuensis]|uniref:TIGR04255 family protein n=1 Tax=Paenibacillus gansuensis TaxID=306542 RepID=A0ABW5PGM2_9BACL
MYIKSATFNSVFPKILNLRKRAIEIEDQLSPHFSSINVLPIPDEAPEVIPRLTTTSHNGHSILEISMTNAQITTEYDTAFMHDPSKCLDYIYKRVFQVTQVLESYMVDKSFFSGLKLQVYFDEFDGKAIELIKEKFLNYKSNKDPHDIEYKITYALNNTHYANFTFSNARVYEGVIPTGISTPIMSELEETSHMLSLSLDVNNRYAFNHIKEYRSDSRQVEEIFSITRDIIENKVQKIIMEGVIEL